MKLYFTPGACSLSPHIVASEAGIPLELIQVDLKTKALKTGGKLNQVNPKNYIPVLILDDGQMLTEGPVILQYLADLKPNANLIPKAGTMERYRVQEWLNFITSEVHKPFSPLFNPYVADDVKKMSLNKLGLRFNFIAPMLQKQPYLMGDDFCVADAYLFTVLNWAQWTHVDLGRWPALKSYVARVAARPKVKEAMKAEGLKV